MRFALLHSFHDGGDDALRRFSDPRDVVLATELADVPRALERVERGVAQGWHAVGYVAYDAAPAFDRALTTPGRHGMPLLAFGLFGEPERAELASLASDCYTPPRWDAMVGRDEHAGAVATVRAAIARGDVYQVNHTVRLAAEFAQDPLALFAHMRRAQPTPFGAYLDLDRYCIASASPELYFERRGDSIVMKPMKGTAPRGLWPAQDDARRDALRGSAKERAENVMIVDLVRNDLGRIAAVGTVRVPSLLTAERYPTLWQMTSTVVATIDRAASLHSILAAVFPCGSVTGAPKVAATRAIAALERQPRGVYCGAIGHIAPGGNATFSVAIRTAVVDRERQRIEYGVGGGITWDSDPASEYDELLAKTKFLSAPAPDFSLIETMRLERGELVRLDGHLTRAERSARWFGRSFDRAAVEQALSTHAEAHAGHDVRRVRLVIDAGGAPFVESEPLVIPLEPWRVGMARDPMNRDDPFLYHKTSHRAAYDRHRAAASGMNDVLLFNHDHELTEFTTGNVVVAIDGVRATPPRECGLLGGVLREQLLATGGVVERVIHVRDLVHADRIWFANSLRGLVPVVLERGM